MKLEIKVVMQNNGNYEAILTQKNIVRLRTNGSTAKEAYEKLLQKEIETLHENPLEELALM